MRSRSETAYSRRELVTRFAAHFRSESVTDDQIREVGVKTAKRRYRRRQFLQNTVVGTTAAYMIHRVPTAVWELLVPEFRSNIGFVKGQEQRLRSQETDSLCLVFGGANTRVADKQAKPIAGELSHLGAVGYVKYANNDVDILGIADKIENYQKKYAQLKTLSFYGVSLGTQVSGAVMEELEKRGSSLKLKALVMDSTPVNFDYTDYPVGKHIARPLDVIGGDSLVTGITNNIVWGDPFKPGSTPPRLYASQGMFLLNGESYLRKLAGYVIRDQAKVAFLRAKDAQKDTTTDPERSEKRLRQDFFPNMDTFKVSGSETNHVPDTDHREGHGNPDQNGIGYREALGKMREKWALAA